MQTCNNKTDKIESIRNLVKQAENKMALSSFKMFKEPTHAEAIPK